MCMKPRLRCAETRFAKLCKVSKGFNWVCAKLLVGCADSRFAEPRTPERKRFYSFRLYEKNQKYPRGLRTSGLRGRFKALPEKILAKFSDGTSRTRLFAQNGGEKALNRCEVRALQRKDLERRLKEQRCSLRTVGYGWVGICGVSCENLQRLRTVKWLVRIGGVLVAKRATFSIHARQCKNEKPFINPPWQHFSTAPKLTCNHKFHPRNPTVSLQYNIPFSKLCNLASAVQPPFRTDSNPHRRYPEALRFSP